MRNKLHIQMKKNSTNYQYKYNFENLNMVILSLCIQELQYTDILQ